MTSAAEYFTQLKKREISREDKVRTKNPNLRTSTKIKDPVIPDDFEKFNEMIGLPVNRNTNKEQKLAKYQLNYHKAIEEHHKVIVNKSRKIGITEAGIRSIAYNCFKRYKGHDIMIIAGNQVSVAQEILLRFYELFLDKAKWGYCLEDAKGRKWHTHEIIKRSSIFSQHPVVEFMNGTRVMCYAASKQGKSQSFRGADDVICIFFSEAAHTGMLEDQPIMNALQPNLANRDNADFILESTPNGRRGFFFNYWMDLKEDKMKGWHTEEWDYHKGLDAKILSKKYLKDEQANFRVDFNQEYCCKFTSTITGVFREEDINYLPPEKESINLLDLIGEKDETVSEIQEDDGGYYPR